jgi:HSP20 family protein
MGSAARHHAEPGILAPAVDVFEDESGMTLMAYFPDAVDVKLQWRAVDGDLLISGDVAVSPEESGLTAPSGTALPQWQRRLYLGPDMDASQCRAAFKYGLLRLRVPRVGAAGRTCSPGAGQEGNHATA